MILRSSRLGLKDTFYSVSNMFLKNHNGGQGNMHYWLNWDLAQMTSILSIGILCDDNVLINQAIVYFKNEEGRYKEAGNIKNAVPFLHQDPDSDEILGQCEESGRDQGHATLCVSLWGHSVRWLIVSVRTCLLLIIIGQ